MIKLYTFTETIKGINKEININVQSLKQSSNPAIMKRRLYNWNKAIGIVKLFPVMSCFFMTDAFNN